MADREVWKFKVFPGMGSYVEMPVGAKIVSVGSQAGEIFAWAIVDPHAEMQPRHLGWFATGMEIPDGWNYVGTVHILADRAIMGSTEVWHVFEEPNA